MKTSNYLFAALLIIVAVEVIVIASELNKH